MKKIIDLTITIEEGMTTFPVYWHPFVEVTQMGRIGIEGRETKKIIIGTHTGTNLDAPRHFIENGVTIDKIPAQDLVGEALVVDLSYKKDYQAIEIEDLQDIPKNKYKIIILKYNWCKNLGKKKYYISHPYLSENAAKFILKKGVKIVAMDTPMPDNPKDNRESNKDSPIHKILLGKGCLILECLRDINKIKKKVVTLVVAPLKLKNGDGASTRVYAIE